MAERTLVYPAYRDELGAVINRNTGVNSPTLATVGNLRVYTFKVARQ